MRNIIEFISEALNAPEAIFIQDSGAMWGTIGDKESKDKFEELLASFTANAKLFGIGNYNKIKMIEDIDDLSCSGPHPGEKIISQIDGLVKQLKPSKCVFIGDEFLFGAASETIKNIAKSQQVELYVICDGSKYIMKNVQDNFSNVNNITVHEF